VTTETSGTRGSGAREVAGVVDAGPLSAGVDHRKESTTMRYLYDILAWYEVQK